MALPREDQIKLQMLNNMIKMMEKDNKIKDQELLNELKKALAKRASIIYNPNDNIANSTFNKPVGWVEIVRGRSAKYPDGFYKISEYADKGVDLYSNLQPGTPKIGNIIYQGRVITLQAHATGQFEDYIRVEYNVSRIATFKDCTKTVPEMLAEVERTGRPLDISIEDINKLMQNDEHLPDNLIEGRHINDYKSLLHRIKNDVKMQMQTLIDARAMRIFTSANLNSMKGVNVPRARVSFDKALDAYDISFQYARSEWSIIESIITLIKGSIPVAQRVYDPKTKTWTIAGVAYPVVKAIFSHIKMDIDEIRPVSADGFFYEDVVNAKGPVTKDTLAVQVKKLLGVDDSVLADDALLKKAYRKKALELHPDRNNGDGSKMSALNEVYNAYTAR